MSNRKTTENELLYFIGKIDPTGDNVKIYKRLFSEMDDAEFESWMDALETGDEVLSFYAPNLSKTRVDIDTLITVSDELDEPLLQRLYLTDEETGIKRLTNAYYLVGLVPVRRQAQTLEAKMSIPEHDSVVDQLTGQPTGDSKGARMSYPEIQVNLSKGLNSMLLELVKFRAGDGKSYSAMKKQIYDTGGASQKEILTTVPSKVKATESLSVLLKAMHISNNL